jgi:uncharacterized RDD family membrane protein YckC
MDVSRYQTFWRRFGASLTDELAFTPFRLVWTLIVFLTVGLYSDRWAFALGAIAGVALLFYGPYFHARWGQTLGKMACGVRVVDASDESKAITTAQAIIRELPNVVVWLLLTSALVGAIVSDPDDILFYDRSTDTWEVSRGALATYLVLTAVALLWFALEALTMALNTRRRSLHDYLAGTVVVKTGYAQQPWPRVFNDQVRYPTMSVVETGLEPPAYADTRPVSETHPMYRAAWDRLGAAVIDNVIFLIPWGVVSSVVLIGTDDRRPALLVGAAGSAIYALYDVVLHAKGGKTIGKMATGLTVVDAETLGPITWRQAWVRSVGIWLSCVGSLVAAISLSDLTASEDSPLGDTFGVAYNDPWTLPAFICMLVSPQRRALHDLIAGTAVVKDAHTSPEPSGPPPRYDGGILHVPRTAFQPTLEPPHHAPEFR